MRLNSAVRPGFAAAAVALLSLAGCRPAASPGAPSDRPVRDAPASTPLPTRQTTIDPVTKQLDAAHQDAERRRSEADQAAK
jgi:hypothetical protein